MDEVALNDADWQAMLNPNILRENVDGEAIEWAEARLKAYPAGKRILIVISDGAPVDDSTLMENGEAYLIRHLRAVIARVEAENVLRLGAIGLNFAVDEYYSMSRFAGPDQDIAAETIKLITALLGDNPT
jgi:cobaltochelatase CobT